MRRPRLFLPPPLASDQCVVLSDQAFGHAVRVLRLRAGAPVTVFDGSGGQFDAVLEQVGRRQARVRIGRYRDCGAESPLTIRLLQGICRGERMDYALQKAVELGVTEVQPLLCERTPPPRSAERLAGRQSHWRRVIESACEQCGRNTLPAIRPILALDAALAGAGGGDTRLVLDPGAGTGLAGLAAPAGRVSLLIGPEGGLGDAELGQARKAEWVPLRLGPRTLRTETAGLAALAAAQTLWGDLG